MNNNIDYLILGAGPAGLQLSYFLHKNEVDYLVLERSDVAGSYFNKFPRHRTLISINKVFTGYDDPDINLRWDWNSLLCDDDKLRFKNYTVEYFPTAGSLVTYLKDFANNYHLKIKYNANVIKINKNGKFEVKLESGEVFYAQKLIVATGLFTPYIPSIPGIENVDDYTTVSLNKKEFENKRVLIIGKRNSGFETANHLIDTSSLIHVVSPHPLKMAWRSHFVGDLRAINNNLLDTYQLKSLNAVVNAEIERIEFKDNQYYVDYAYTLANNEKETICYDRVITCTGFRFDNSIFEENCSPKLSINDRFAALTPHYESVNVKDMYFAGTLMQERDYKKEQSAFIHGFRYNVKFLAQYFEYIYSNKPFPGKTFASDPRALAKEIITCINKTSALWQQTGYLADCIVHSKQDDCWYYYQEMPVDFIRTELCNETHDYFIITLEFGQKRIDEERDVFAIDRIHKDDDDQAALSTGIHPIVRHYRNNECVAEHHVIEDFESVWAEDVHYEPLLAFFESELSSDEVSIKKPIRREELEGL